jgi:putative DNA primase/helicase
MTKHFMSINGGKLADGSVEVAGQVEVHYAKRTDGIPEYSDFALADSFAAKYGDVFRHVTNRGEWYHYDGKVWSPDEKLHRYTSARSVCADVARIYSKEESIKKLLTHANTIADVIKVAGYDAGLKSLIDDFDKNPMLLNTQDGIVDLRDGSLQKHDPGQYLSKITSCGVGGECPTWLQFLGDVTCGDKELQAYLKRVIGYALTGSIQEHALFFLYGSGANGKSVFIGVIAGILNTYHRTAAMQTFIVSTSDQHPTDVAGLVGSRAVTASETERGRTWDENKIKTITGGDELSARFMRGDFFEYVPQFKILIAGNNKPKLKSTDEAIRRRFNLIPFLATIPKEKRDPLLGEKLKAEYPGILKWAIEGCLEWQRDGLNPPAIVREATEEYINSQNVVSNWIEERCDKGRGCKATAGELYADFKEWTRTTGEEILKQVDFTTALEGMRYLSKKTNIGRVWDGLKLRQAVKSDGSDGSRH